MSTPTAESERLRELVEDGEQFIGYVHADETSEGHYYAVIREWPHPDQDGARILSERYAYLTKNRAEGSDGWVSGGINRHVRGDTDESADFAAALGRAYVQAAVRLRTGNGDPHAEDLVNSED